MHISIRIDPQWRRLRIKTGACLGRALLDSDGSDIYALVKKLNTRGGMEQLRMFLTGPDGAGKNTALTVVHNSCFDFFHAVGILWSDMIFLFTAYTRSGASLFGGVSICTTAYINKKGSLSEDDKQE